MHIESGQCVCIYLQHCDRPQMVEFNKSCLVNITIISVIQYVVPVYEHFTDNVSTSGSIQVYEYLTVCSYVCSVTEDIKRQLTNIIFKI